MKNRINQPGYHDRKVKFCRPDQLWKKRGNFNANRYDIDS